MSVEAVKTTPESYQLTPQESQFLKTLTNIQGDIFKTLDKEEIFHGLKEIPYTILREQLAEQQLLQLFPKSHKLRQIINQFDHEMAYFKMWYSDPIIVQRFADASGKTFDEAKEYLDNILATARIVPLVGESRIRGNMLQKSSLSVTKKRFLEFKNNKKQKICSNFSKIQSSLEGISYCKKSESKFLNLNQKTVFAKPGFYLTGIHELTHLVNAGTIKIRNKMNNKMKLYGTTMEQLSLFYKLYIDQTKNDKNIQKAKKLFGLINDRDYYNESHEISSRVMEIRYHLNLQPYHKITRDEIKDIYKEMNKATQQLIYIIYVINKQEEFINLINTSF